MFIQLAFSLFSTTENRNIAASSTSFSGIIFSVVFTHSSGSFELKVAEPSSRGEETYLNHAISQPVSIKINTREKGISQGGSFCNVELEVLNRWRKNGFLPVEELSKSAANTLVKIRNKCNEQEIIPKNFL